MTTEATDNDTETSMEDIAPETGEPYPTGGVTVADLDLAATAAVGALETARVLCVSLASHGVSLGMIQRAQQLAYAALEHLGVLEELIEIHETSLQPAEEDAAEETPALEVVHGEPPVLSGLDRAYLGGRGCDYDRERVNKETPGRSEELDAMFSDVDEEESWDFDKEKTLFAVKDQQGAWWGFVQYDLHEEVGYDDTPLFPVTPGKYVVTSTFTRVKEA